jgi:hypothetical protein
MKTITLKTLIATALMAGALAGILAAPAGCQVSPLQVGPTGRYLTDSSGTPVFVNGDAAYSMVAQLTYAQANQYLTDRAGRGFNAIITNLLEGFFADLAPKNIANVAPFTGANFTTPNPAYFALVDSMISRANQLGIHVFLFPLYLGNPWSQGWGNQVNAASVSAMTSWGTYVGNRYKNYPNIIWVIGGDTDPTPVRAKVDAFTTALKAADNLFPNRLITGHSARGVQITSSFGTSFGESWLNLNNTYTSLSTTVSLADAAYSAIPTMPFFLIESDYENEGPTTQGVRAEAYWTILRGGCGQVFGNCPIWSCGSTKDANCSASNWTSAWSSAGSVSMNYFRSFFTSRPWYKLIPDKSAAIITAGAQSGVDLATFAYASDSTCIIGYLPGARTVTVNPAILLGTQIHAQWFNPATGAYTDLGTLSKTSRSYTPPGSGDWVLLIDWIPATPSAPALVSPADGATGISVSPTISWGAVGGATSYHLQVSPNSQFSSLIVDQNGLTTTSQAVSGLSLGTHYYWHVAASNGAGAGSYSSTWGFTTSVNCCVGLRGNVNGLGAVDLLDLSSLVSYLTGAGYVPPCYAEADADGSGVVNLVDLATLASYLTGGGFVPGNCP